MASTVSDTSISESISSSGDSLDSSPTLSPKTLINNKQQHDQLSVYTNLSIIQPNGQIQQLQTILRDM